MRTSRKNNTLKSGHRGGRRVVLGGLNLPVSQEDLASDKCKLFHSVGWRLMCGRMKDVLFTFCEERM